MIGSCNRTSRQRLGWGLTAVAAIALSGCTITQPTLQETRELELTVEPDGRLIVDAGAGSLALEGESNSSAIRVTAEIYQIQANDDYTLTLAADASGAARLVSRVDSRVTGSNDLIALSIRVPESMTVDISDSSGSMRVEGLRAPLSIEDGSGSMNVSDIGADLVVKDGSGSMRAANIDGVVEIKDTSGSITLENVSGDVTIDDGSGSITARNIGGKVTVDDGSGSINVDGAGDFELIDDGSGGINLDGIRSRD
jgi:hypothetical protein